MSSTDISNNNQSHTTQSLQPLQRASLYWTIADALVLAKRHLIQIPRIPEELIFATIQPVMFVLLFRYVFGGAIAINGTSYVNYLMAGIFAQTVIFGSTSTGIGLATDLQKGLVDRFRSLPMAKSAVLTGRTISDIVRNAFIVLVMWLVGLLVGFRPEGNVLSWFAGAGLLLSSGFSRSPLPAAPSFPPAACLVGFVPSLSTNPSPSSSTPCVVYYSTGPMPQQSGWLFSGAAVSWLSPFP